MLYVNILAGSVFPIAGAFAAWSILQDVLGDKREQVLAALKGYALLPFPKMNDEDRIGVKDQAIPRLGTKMREYRRHDGVEPVVHARSIWNERANGGERLPDAADERFLAPRAYPSFKKPPEMPGKAPYSADTAFGHR